MPGVTDILGLEFAGNIVQPDGSLGKRVMSLLPGGGYSEFVAVNTNHLIDIPENISIEEVFSILVIGRRHSWSVLDSIFINQTI